LSGLRAAGVASLVRVRVRPWPVTATRARAASLAGTSRTAPHRPAAAAPAAGRSRSRPPPPRPARATVKRTSASAGSCGHQCRTGPSRARSPGYRALDRHRQLMRIYPDDHPVCPLRLLGHAPATCQRGRAPLLRAQHTLLEPRPATAPGQDACQKRATLTSRDGQPLKERLAGHLTRACADPGHLKRHK
jgi:hypothetical protein